MHPVPLSRDEMLYLQGLEEARVGRQREALFLLRKASAALPERGDIAYNLGVVLQQAGQLEQAIEVWIKATSLAPYYEVAWVNLALALAKSQDYEQAVTMYRQWVVFHANSRNLLYNFANLLAQRGAYEESLDVFDRLCKAYPADSAAWINRAKTAKSAGKEELAEFFSAKAIELGGAHAAHAYFNRANLLLRQKRWTEGFIDYEWRRSLPGALPAPWGIPSYQAGIPLDSHLLVWSDQGLGDALMFLRFVPELVARGHKVSLFVQTPLKSLLQDFPGIHAVYSPEDARPSEFFEAALAIGSIPYELGLNPELSWRGPYIKAIKEQHLPIKKQRRHVGLVWSGNPKHENDRHRSVTLQSLMPLFDLPDIAWVSLQHGPQAKDILKMNLAHKIYDASPQLVDLKATSNFIEALDLIITVDTSVSHLAGAMGKDVWTLIPAIDSDWRWGSEGKTSFWYPSMMLLRQKKADIWGSAVQEMFGLLSEGLEKVA
jgi:Flp pilus assembly protein TadD